MYSVYRSVSANKKRHRAQHKDNGPFLSCECLFRKNATCKESKQCQTPEEHDDLHGNIPCVCGKRACVEYGEEKTDSFEVECAQKKRKIGYLDRMCFFEATKEVSKQEWCRKTRTEDCHQGTAI